eukprot:TRINITY_DN6047_c0_g1_i1.p1 TRINITY_DN6047_c0_g1~~TRINITY_DN6047_c0_g1_i1.p1  ORF type:complete len:588 (-),score=72.90 TRINITY_DN6047_c0_g1_i1:87-1826(-)
MWTLDSDDFDISKLKETSTSLPVANSLDDLLRDSEDDYPPWESEGFIEEKGSPLEQEINRRLSIRTGVNKKQVSWDIDPSEFRVETNSNTETTSLPVKQHQFRQRPQPQTQSARNLDPPLSCPDVDFFALKHEGESITSIKELLVNEIDSKTALSSASTNTIKSSLRDVFKSTSMSKEAMHYFFGPIADRTSGIIGSASKLDISPERKSSIQRPRAESSKVPEIVVSFNLPETTDTINNITEIQPIEINLLPEEYYIEPKSRTSSSSESESDSDVDSDLDNFKQNRLKIPTKPREKERKLDAVITRKRGKIIQAESNVSNTKDAIGRRSHTSQLFDIYQVKNALNPSGTDSDSIRNRSFTVSLSPLESLGALELLSDGSQTSRSHRTHSNEINRSDRSKTFQKSIDPVSEDTSFDKTEKEIRRNKILALRNQRLSTSTNQLSLQHKRLAFILEKEAQTQKKMKALQAAREHIEDHLNSSMIPVPSGTPVASVVRRHIARETRVPNVKDNPSARVSQRSYLLTNVTKNRPRNLQRRLPSKRKLIPDSSGIPLHQAKQKFLNDVQLVLRQSNISNINVNVK